MGFYSYLWLREDGTPYYAGKGSGKRAFIRAHHRMHPPKDKSLILVFPHTTEAEAFESEIAFIKWFGRKDLGTGCLRNMTDGGENPPPWRKRGYRRSQEFCQALGVRSKGNKYALGCSPSADTRSKLSAVHAGKPLSVEHREKLSAAKKGSTHSEATKKKMSASHQGQIPWNKGLSVQQVAA